MKKTDYYLATSASLLVAGVGFGIAGFCVPPVGEVADSVLILIAQCFIAGGSFVGIAPFRMPKSQSLPKGEEVARSDAQPQEEQETREELNKYFYKNKF